MSRVERCQPQANNDPADVPCGTCCAEQGSSYTFSFHAFHASRSPRTVSSQRDSSEIERREKKEVDSGSSSVGFTPIRLSDSTHSHAHSYCGHAIPLDVTMFHTDC